MSCAAVGSPSMRSTGAPPLKSTSVGSAEIYHGATLRVSCAPGTASSQARHTWYFDAIAGYFSVSIFTTRTFSLPSEGRGLAAARKPAPRKSRSCARAHPSAPVTSHKIGASIWHGPHCDAKQRQLGASTQRVCFCAGNRNASD